MSEQDPRIDLYGLASPNVLKIVLMLEELQLPFSFHFVNVFAEEQFTDEFRRLNPNCKTPVLVDRRGAEPLAMFESGAILIYLAETAGAMLPESGPTRYAALQWLMIQLTGIGPMFGQHVHFLRYQTDIDYARSRYFTESQRLLDVVETRLSEAAFLGGEDYSIADIATFPWYAVLDRMELPLGERPHTARWMETLAARPGVERYFNRAKPIIAATSAAVKAGDNEGLDRFLGRGKHFRS